MIAYILCFVIVIFIGGWICHHVYQSHEFKYYDDGYYAMKQHPRKQLNNPLRNILNNIRIHLPHRK